MHNRDDEFPKVFDETFYNFVFGKTESSEDKPTVNIEKEIEQKMADRDEESNNKGNKHTGSAFETIFEEESVKHDEDKPAMQYIPKEAMWEMGKAFAFGASKYGPSNYKKSGLGVSRCCAAAIRHIYQYIDGEDHDPESKALHLGNAMSALAMAIYTHYNFPEKDDRYRK